MWRISHGRRQAAGARRCGGLLDSWRCLRGGACSMWARGRGCCRDCWRRAARGWRLGPTIHRGMLRRAAEITESDESCVSASNSPTPAWVLADGVRLPFAAGAFDAAAGDEFPVPAGRPGCRDRGAGAGDPAGRCGGVRQSQRCHEFGSRRKLSRPSAGWRALPVSAF